MKPVYRMYVDESGDSCMKNFKNKNSEILCLNGFIIRISDYKDIKLDIDSLKTLHFNIDTENDNYPLHRIEIIKKEPPFDVLKDEAKKTSFNEDLLGFLKSWDFATITVLIDKKKLIRKYSNPYNPYLFGFALLMERYTIFLKQNNSVGDIMVESINTKHDKKLKNVYKSLCQYDYPKLNFFHGDYSEYLTSDELKLEKKKECNAGLEVTDLLINSLKRIIYKISYPDKYSYSTFDDDIFKAIKDKILSKNGKKWKIGLKVFP